MAKNKTVKKVKRVRNTRGDKFLKGAALASAVLCLAAFGLGAWFSLSSEYYYDLEKERKVEISDEEDLLALGEAGYNDELTLKEDIHLSREQLTIGSNERPFRGHFDGRGRTVYCDFDSVADGTSLFGCIDYGGIVENTNFVFGDVTVNGSTYAGIAEINYGTIRNCTVTFENCKITKSNGIFSAAVAFNRGTVANLIVDCTYSTDLASKDEKAIFIGPVCAYNYGTLRGNVSLPKFSGFRCTDEFLILTGETVNVGIAAICSATVEEGTTALSAAVLGEGVYVSDKVSELFTSTDRTKVFNRSRLFDELDFDNRVWDLSETSGNMQLKHL